MAIVPPSTPFPFRPRRLQDFHDLMRHRVMDILLVSSPYDSFRLEEAGELAERVMGEFRNLDLHYGPGVTVASSGEEALATAREQRPFQLIISTLYLADMNGAEMARKVAEAGLTIPVILLAFDNRELKDFMARHDLAAVDRIFLWQGDARILLAIVKYVEDKRNVAHDTRAAGVQVIILVEDNIRYYSSFLPAIYAELLHHSQRLIAEGANLSQKILRMRARPKILLCGSFEEAWETFTAYEDEVLGVVSDIEFPHEGRRSKQAGLDLARRVWERCPDVPILLQSSRPVNEAFARELGAGFLLKGSPLLLQDLRRYMTEYFGFGDFTFRMPDGREVGRAGDLKTLEELLSTVPLESIAYHGERNHFSKWLKARTEFAVAHELRPRKIRDFPTLEDLRQTLIASIAAYRRERTQGVVADFDRTSFDLAGDFHRMGGGSLGGKARGLAFLRRLLAETGLREEFPDVRVLVPPAVVLGTDVFDRFLEANDLRDVAIHGTDDAEIRARFLTAELPEEARQDLAAFLERVDYPLAVRSSSLLEDSRYQPFTGVYETVMISNNHPFLGLRLDELMGAIKRVYASTFSRHAKDYIRATPYRLEEEKMAVILQRLVGQAHGSLFYPAFAGVARSYNFYPTAPLAPADGIAAVALGLGRTVVEGGNCVRFCPRHPQHLVQLSSVRDALANSQRSFWALDLLSRPGRDDLQSSERQLGLETAEADGTLANLASTYSAENDAVYDGLSRPGVRLVTFAPILKQRAFPLAKIVERLLAIAEWGMGSPVEIEFAVDLSRPRGVSGEFGLLQLRPLALSREAEEVEVGELPAGQLLCSSRQVLGNGKIEDIRDLVVVDRQRFDRSRSPETASELAQLNARLVDERLPYLLVGVGRWGSADPWLGIPVTWDQIGGARVIVEAGFEGLRVTPSQGTHFFQNLTSFNVGYFTVNPEAGDGFLDWDWLAAQPALRETTSVRHLRLDAPIVVLMNGKRNQGVILKPGG